MTICLLTDTTPHQYCEILIMYIFHESTFQTLLQLSKFSISKVKTNLKESSLEFRCNVILNKTACPQQRKLWYLHYLLQLKYWYWYEMKHLN